MYMVMFRVENAGYDSPRTTLRVLYEDSKVGKTLPTQCQTTPSKQYLVD